MTQQARSLTIRLEGDERFNLLYRPNTRDRKTIEDIWTNHPYRLARYGGIARRLFIDETYLRILAEGRRPLIVDAGANIGASVRAFRAYYPEAHIIAIEPEAGNFVLLKTNVAGVPGVECHQAAVASADGFVRLTDPGRSTDAYRTGAAAEGQEIGTVQAMSMATILALAPDTSPLLAKIDIEGAEAELFASNTDWVDRFPAIAIELHDWMLPGQASAAPFLKCVSERGRDFIQPPTDISFSLRNPA